MRRSRISRVFVVGALVGGVLIVASGENPALAALPNPPVSPTVTLNGSTATISWTTPTATLPARRYYEVVATDTTSTPNFFGESWACAGCTSLEWPGLLADHDYSFAIRAINTQNEASTTVTATTSVPAAGCDGVAGLCVTVDTSDVGDAHRFVGSGMLHGIASPTEPDYDTFVEPLALRQWRLNSGPNIYWSKARQTWDYLADNAPGFDPSTTGMVAARWHQDNPSPVSDCGGPRARTPWEDLNPLTNPFVPNWAFYDNWLVNMVNGENTAGRHHDYWDVLNEQNNLSHVPFYNSDKSFASRKLICPNPLTAARILELLRRTNISLHQLGEKVLAPAYAGWTEEIALGPAGAHVINLEEMLTMSDASSLTWDGISYHANASESGHYLSPGVPNRVANWQGTPQSVITNASQVRALMANHTSTSGSEGLFINEYLANNPNATNPNYTFNAPGRFAGMLWGLTHVDPVEANLTCSTIAYGQDDPAAAGLQDCDTGSLNGLLYLDSNGDPHVRGAWHTMESYTHLTGDLVEAASTDETLTAISTYDDEVEKVTMLLGRFNYADYTISRNDADTTVAVETPAGFGSTVTFTIQQVPDSGYGAAPPLPAAIVCDATVNGSGIAIAVIEDFPDSDAYMVTIEPDTGSNPACP